MDRAPLLERVESVIRRYDICRATTYRGRPGNPNQIEIQALNLGTMIRFPAVGYFNQVYGFQEKDFSRLAEVRDFFLPVATGFKVYAAAGEHHGKTCQRLGSAGWHAEANLVRFYRRAPLPPAPDWPKGLTIERLRGDEVDVFFRTYLEAFGAAQEKRSPAIENMRLLYKRDGLHFLFAKMHGQPAGIGMIYVDGSTACLCAGAVLGPWANRGLQRALIYERLRLAEALGCDLTVSWTEENGQSHRNLVHFGFRVAYVDPIWRPAD